MRNMYVRACVALCVDHMCVKLRARACCTSKRRGLSVHVVDGDGACLFRSRPCLQSGVRVLVLSLPMTR